jgi:cell division protein FtsL
MTMSRVRSRGTIACRTHPRQSRQVSVVMFLSIAMVLFGVLLYLWPQMYLVELGYRQGELQDRRTREVWHQKELQVEFATLRRLSRIEQVAKQRLGMRSPQVSQIIYVRPDGQLVTSGGQR